MVELYKVFKSAGQSMNKICILWSIALVRGIDISSPFSFSQDIKLKRSIFYFQAFAWDLSNCLLSYGTHGFRYFITDVLGCLLELILVSKMVVKN